MKVLRPERSMYRIEMLEGQGLSSSVYRAVREDSRGHSQQVVALKILKNEKLVPWLRREFATLKRIDSPHCVRVLGWENLTEGSALVLEWIDGLSLSELAKQQPLSRDLILEIVAQVQMGLKHLSHGNLCHGDLSPGNILIDRSGRVRVIDFGTMPPDAGMITGTPGYIAPEVWAGQSPNLQSDLYALGRIADDLESANEEGTPLSDRLTDQNRYWSPLVAPDAKKRKMMKLSPLEERQRMLADCVSQVLACRRLQTQTRTLLLQGAEAPAGKARRTFPVALLLLWMTATTPVVRAQAPIHRSIACLKIRSSNWLEVSVPGHSADYAPLEFENLPVGPISLKWRSAHGFGNLSVNLVPGPCLILNQSQFTAARDAKDD